LTGQALAEYKQKIKDWKLVPVGGGAFELTVNGELIYSKLETGEFPDEGKILKELGKRLKKG
jgi:selenoprotein W-related protein